MDGSLQHWLDRNRPPRVQITYDVETLGATVKQEIPFIAGIIGDFAGGARPESAMAERGFVEIDRDNFKQAMQGIGPSLQLTDMAVYTVVRTPEGPGVQASTTSPTVFAPALSFGSMDDFAPPSIVAQVPELARLMQTRQNLSDLVAKLGTTPSLEATYAGFAAEQAGATLTQATTVLDSANTMLTTAETGTQALFGKAADAVLAVETSGLNFNAVTNAKAAVDAATLAYTTAYGTAKADKHTSADVQIAGAKLWQVAAALRDGVALLTRITAGYPAAGDPKDLKTLAVQAVSAASTGTNGTPAFTAAAGKAALIGSSALALNPSQATPPAQSSTTPTAETPTTQTSTTQTSTTQTPTTQTPTTETPATP
jgi:type VI secretion system protein ImpB